MAAPMNNSAVGVQDEYRPGGWTARYVFIVFILMLVGEIGMLLATYPISALPQIGAHYQTSQVAWIPTIYFLIAALISTIVGTLADRFGKKRVIVFNLALASVGLLISAFAPTFAVLLFGRALQAPMLTMPFLLPSLARDIFPTKTVPLAAAMAVTGAGVLGVPSTMLAGHVIEGLGFRAAFWVPAIFSMTVLFLVLTVVPESAVRQRKGRPDLLGALLLGAGVSSILVAVSFGASWGWASARVLTALVVGVALLVGWVTHTRRSPWPLVDLRQLGSLPIVITMLFAGVGMAMSSWMVVAQSIIALTPTANGGLGMDPIHQTQLTAVFSFGGTIAGVMVGWSLRRRPAGDVAILGMLLLTAGFAFAYLAQGSVPMFYVAMLLVGIGGAAGITTAYILVFRLVVPEQQAAMSSTFALAFNLITSIASVTLLSTMNSYGTPDPATGVIAYGRSAFAAGLLIPLGLCVLAVLGATVLRRTPVGSARPESLTSEPDQPSPIRA